MLPPNYDHEIPEMIVEVTKVANLKLPAGRAPVC